MRKLFPDLKTKINPGHTALLIVDVQKDFCAPDGEYARRGLDVSMMLAMAPRLKGLIDAAREKGVFIIFIQGLDGVEEVLADVWVERIAESGLPPDRLFSVAGTEGAEFFPPVLPQKDDLIITKYRYSAFTGTNLDQVLRSNNILTVIVTGVVTEICVEATVRSAGDLDYRVVVVEDCTGTKRHDIQESALERMEIICAERATSEQLMDAWST